ncbi:hypothetical protein PIB30_056408 [Stylosanthes scabra]|uniref:Uncharacterized protein n=1 Tax=Stylosanthes scabra TaxID=79078 RepID=A0ABU6YGR5_9FABA|nr:hypothetical protein [Stylosanthes scabra]
MENVKALSLTDTGIEDLPRSFCNVSGLRHLEMTGDVICKIPSVITMMSQLYTCVISRYGNRLMGKLTGVPSSNRIHHRFNNINLSDDFFPIAVAWFANVTSLNLSGNDFTVLPECIQQFHLLRELIVDRCKHLREISGIPPKLECFSALYCNSLSSRCTSVLLNQEVHEGKSTHFVMPGIIPRWFKQRCSGASISFWFRGLEFPHNALCVAILLKDYISMPFDVILTVAISGNRVRIGERITMNQLFIFNLDLQDYHLSQTLEKGWNHIEVSYKAFYNSSIIAKEIGMQN